MNEPRIERQEIYCHDCGKYVQFDLDVNMNGNHVLECPNCGHEHCRIVEDGVITDTRWDSRNRPILNQHLPTFYVSSTTMTTSSSSTFTTFSGGSTGTYESWLNTTTSATTGYF